MRDVARQVIKRLVQFLSRNSVRRTAPLIVVSAIVMYFYMTRGLSFRELIIAVAALVIGFIVFNGERGIQYGFVLWVLTLALGDLALA